MSPRTLSASALVLSPLKTAGFILGFSKIFWIEAIH